MQANLIDPRDNPGKKHDFHFVLLSVLLAVMSGKVFISEIHRFLVRHHDCLCELLGLNMQHSISDAQLRRLLSLVDEKNYQYFHARYFGWQAETLLPDNWISFDGKELRGTIDRVSAEKRGLCLVRPLIQAASISLPGIFYHGDKDSDRRPVRSSV